MSVVLKNVLHSRCRQGKMPDFNVKRFFCFIPRYEIANFKQEKGWREHNAHLFCISTMQDCIARIYQTAWVHCSFFHLLVGVWRCLYFDGLRDCNSLRLFCVLAYRLLTKINKWFAKMKNKDIFANKLNLLLCHYSE